MKKVLIFLALLAEMILLTSANMLPERTYEFLNAAGDAQQLEIYCGKTGERSVNFIKDGYKISLGKTLITLEKSGETLTMTEYPGLKEAVNINAVFYVKNSENGTQTVFSIEGKEYINFTDFSKYKKREEITLSIPKGQAVSVTARETEYKPEIRLYMNKKLDGTIYASRKVNWYRTDGKINYYGEKKLNPGEKISFGGYFSPSLLDTGSTIYAEYEGKVLCFAKVPGKCAAYIRNENILFANGKYEYMEETVPQSEYIPLRKTCEALKLKLSYTPQKTTLKSGKDNTVLLHENKNYVTFNNKKINFNKSAMYIQNNTAMVHKNVFLALGCKVYENQGTVAVSKNTEITDIGKFGESAAVMKNLADANQNLIMPVTLIGNDSAFCGITFSDDVKTDAVTAVYVNDKQEAKELDKKLKEKNPPELFVISEKADCIKTLVRAHGLVHGVLDLRGETKREIILNKTLSANCRTVLLDNADNAYYLSKFNITVWTKAETSKEFYKAAINGAGGIITDNPEKSAKLMQIFSEPTALLKYMVYGHRGTTEYARENTLKAAEMAISAGADYIEFDIWQTLDNEAVVMHDGTTGRMYAEDLVIKETSLNDLKKIDMDGEKILTLKEYLSALKKYENVVFNIEIKGGTAELAETAAQTLKELDMTDRAYISSFDTTVQKVLSITAPYLACTALSSAEYTDAVQVYSAERETGSMLTGVREPALRELRLRGERRNALIDIDSEYTVLGKNFDGYVAYVKNTPHEITVKNGIPKVLNRLGEEISVPDLEKIRSDGVKMYRCRVKRVNKSYYIYGIE